MKSLNLDKVITTCLEKKVARLNKLIETEIKKDKVEEFIDSDTSWIIKIAKDKGYDIFPYLNYYFTRLRRRNDMSKQRRFREINLCSY